MQQFLLFSTQLFYLRKVFDSHSSVLPPHHLINQVYIPLNDANHLHGHGFIHIVGAGLAQNALLLHFDSHFGGVEQLPGGNARQDEVTGLQRLGALGGGADAHSGNGMTDGQIEAALLGQRTGVGDNRKCVHLQFVVIVEAQRLIDPDTRIQFEAALFQTVLASGMAGVQDGHIILFCQRIDGSEQTQEVLFRVDVLLTVGGQQNVLVLFQPQTLQHVAFLNLFQIHVQHFRHGRAGLVGALLG